MEATLALIEKKINELNKTIDVVRKDTSALVEVNKVALMEYLMMARQYCYRRKDETLNIKGIHKIIGSTPGNIVPPRKKE